MVASDSNTARSAILRILKNAGWLLGGKGFGAISSLIYLAILSRSLGVKDFGHFALIFGIAQTAVAFFGFQTWQTIVRFGAPHIAKGNWAAFGRLSVAGGLVDAVGATAGSLIATIVILTLGHALELNPAYDDIALAFIIATLWARVSAPYGIIRALDRFELTVLVGAITPAGRLLAAIVVWLTGPSVERFLLAWALIEFITATAMWVTAYRLRPGLMNLARLRELPQAIDDNNGIVKFLGITYCNTSLLAVIHQGPLLAVGYFLGTSAAGVYRIADQLAKGLSKLALLISDAVYPEVNRQRYITRASEFRKIIVRINITAFSIAVFAVAIAMSVGTDLLTLIAGNDFAAGGIILVPLVLAASFELAGVAYEPVLHSFGKPHYQLIVRSAAAALLTVLVISATGLGSTGVAWSLSVAQALEYLVLSAIVTLILRRYSPKESSA